MIIKETNTLLGEVGEIFARYYIRKQGYYPVLKPLFIQGNGLRLLPSASPAINPRLWECASKFNERELTHIFRASWDYLAFGEQPWGHHVYVFQVKTSRTKRTIPADKLPSQDLIFEAKALGFRPYLLRIILSSGWNAEVIADEF